MMKMNSFFFYLLKKNTYNRFWLFFKKKSLCDNFSTSFSPILCALFFVL